jgi:hypothetical protein
MKYYLVIESNDYADEFDIEGFKVFKSENEESLEIQLIDDQEFPCEKYFGTNEAIEFETKEDFLESLSIVEITEEELKVLKKLFGKDITKYAFGTTSII